MNRLVISRVEVFLEEDAYVALCPDLDVSSFGDTAEEAKLKVPVTPIMTNLRTAGMSRERYLELLQQV
jgi:hypothetical protein